MTVSFTLELHSDSNFSLYTRKGQVSFPLDHVVFDQFQEPLSFINMFTITMSMFRCQNMVNCNV